MDKPLDEMTQEELLELDAQNSENEEVVEEKADTETETPSEEVQTAEIPDADTETETPDYDSLFNESGLSQQYPGGIKEMLDRVPETNKYVRRLQEENNEFKRLLIEKLNKQEEPPKPTPEDIRDKFDTNPTEALKEAGMVDSRQLDETNQKLSQIEKQNLYNYAANVISDYEGLESVAKSLRQYQEPEPGKNALWDTIMHLSNQFNGMDSVPLPTKMALLYDRAKQMVEKTNKKPPVTKVSQTQKDAATTTSPGKANGSDKPNFEKMSSEELLNYAKENGSYIA